MRKVSVLLLCFSFLMMASQPSLRNIYVHERTLQLDGKFYFTPVAESSEAVAFGYISKVRPTEEELKAERERLRRIVDEAIKRQYGSYENYYREMEKIGQEAGESYSRKAPGIIKDIMPPSFIKEAVPLLMKGMVLVMRNLPWVSQPVGNLGETGVVIVRKDLSFSVVKLGVNEPVEFMDFSPDGKLLAVLSDLSYEDKKGNVHIVGRVSLIETATGRIISQWIFRNVRDELRFAPDGKLAVLYYPWGERKERKVFFINTRTLRVEEQALKAKFFSCKGGIDAVNVKWPVVNFSPDGRYMGVYLSGWFLEIYTYPQLKPYFKIKADCGPWLFSPDGKYFMDGGGKLWDLPSKSLVGDISKKIKMKPRFPGVLDARFAGDKLYITDRIGIMRVLSLPELNQLDQSDFYSRITVLKFSPDGRYVASLFTPTKGPRIVSYGKRMRVERAIVKILDASSARLLQLIEDLKPTALSVAFLGDRLVVSDFEGIKVYRKARGF